MSFTDQGDGGSAQRRRPSGSPGSDAARAGRPDSPAKITDPRALRALAHPARIAILQHLALDGPATATECAEIAGLSPSACSYHLRALARYGFVAEERSTAADQRHRPWRALVISISIGEDPDETPTVRAAGRLVVEALQARTDELRAEYLDHGAQFQRDWQALGSYQDVMHLTPGELAEVRQKIADILAQYRRLDPRDQPPGARRVHATAEFLPWFKLEADS
jgi:DNA-binding transcriptional ArsR family regulator